MKRRWWVVGLGVLSALLAGCESKPQRITVNGAAAKGPFVLGSSVTSSPVDGLGNPTGQSFPALTQDDEGRFTLSLAYQGPVQMQVVGYAFNEATGRLSTGPMTLNAMGEFSTAPTQNAFVNIVTHLSFQRTRSLMGQGLSFARARAQAESELRSELAIGPGDLDAGLNGIAIDLLGGDSDATAWLFAISSIFAGAGEVAGAGQGGLQELINNAAAQFGATGALSTVTKDLLRAAEMRVRPSLFEERLRRRLDDIGSIAPVPDLDRVLDSDRDGVINAADSCALISNPNQQVIPPGVCSIRSSTIVAPVVSVANPGTLRLLHGELTGDGQDDFLAVGFQRVVLWPSADGGLAAPVALNIGAPSGANATPTLIDINRDGVLDLLSVGATDEHSAVWYGQPGGGFSSTGVPFLLPGLSDWNSVRTVDVNGDGHLDLVYPSNGDMAVLAAPAVGQSWPTAPIKSRLATERMDATGDLSGDGRVDLLMLELLPTYTYALRIAVGDGSGGFSDGPIVYQRDPGVMQLPSTTVEDVDSDGRDDILVLYDDASFVLFAEANGSFTRVELPRSPGAGRLFAADLTGDGLVDVGMSGRMELLCGAGGRQFQPPVMLPIDTDSFSRFTGVFVASPGQLVILGGEVLGQHPALLKVEINLPGFGSW